MSTIHILSVVTSTTPCSECGGTAWVVETEHITTVDGEPPRRWLQCIGRRDDGADCGVTRGAPDDTAEGP